MYIFQWYALYIFLFIIIWNVCLFSYIYLIIYKILVYIFFLDCKSSIIVQYAMKNRYIKYNKIDI